MAAVVSRVPLKRRKPAPRAGGTNGPSEIRRGAAVVRDEDVKAFASQLCAEGIDAHEWGEETIEGRILIGIIVKGLGFFPVWELNDPTNQALLASRNFGAIKTNREPDWEPVEPRLWRRVRGKQH